MTNYMHKENIEDVYPLSDIQLGMIYYSLKAPDTAVYHNQMVFQRKDRDFEPEVFKKAMLLMVKKHSILRTGFNIENSKKPLQIVFKNINPDILHHDLSQMVKEQQENHIKSFLMQDRKKPFDLTTPGLLWKLRTFALGDDNICFIWICHHAITDGWSTASLLTELNNTYIKLKSNSHYVPQKLKSSYKEFILQQRLEKKNEKTIQYWRNELTGYKRLNFPGVINSKHIAAKKMEYSKDLGNEFREKLNKIAVKYNISFKNLCFSAYIYMLSMLSYDGEVVAGLVTHNRPVCEDGDKIIGCFLNTVPFRIQIPYSLTWADYINLMNKKLVELAYYNNLPLPEITKIIGEESIEQNPIFDTFFNFMDFHIYHQLISLGDAETGQKENESMLSINSFEETNISFNFDVTAFSKNFSIRLTYSNTLLSNEFAERLAGYFVEVLNKFIHDPERIIIREELMSEIEKRKLLLEFNQTNTEYPKDKTIHQLFEEQALKTPDYIAIVGDAGVKEKKGRREEEKNVGAGPRACPVNLTYRQLNEESDRLAGILIEKGVLPDTIVGIIMERSVEMIIGIFGILKSSGAYLPIEPEYPKERIDFMLKDSGAKLLITTNDIESEKVRSWKGEKYYIEVLSCSSYPLTFLPLCLQNPSNLAYVIYTSGSTGWPKGVIVEHRGVMNYIKWAERFYLQGKSFDFAFYSSLAFDLTVTSIYVPLISGNKIVVYPNDEKEFVISKILREDRVQVIKLTPTHLKMVMNMFPGDVKNIKKLIVGGEDLAVELACEIHRLFKGNIEIYNEYGPTETTVGCMIHKFDPSADCRQSVPIGVPITNTNIYILDYYQCPIVAGVAGELYVSGEGLARGYLNKPELSAEKFIHFHHSSFDIPRIHHSKLYKTGDLAMWLPDGKVEFLGRIDHQVKIRGFRIEPGEIERQLLSHDGIKASAVITIVEKDENYLCAYFTSDEKIEIPKLRDNLAKKLPNYMIPSYFIQIESIPLTTSGKIDRNALISIGHKQDAEIEFVAPQNETEKIIASVWKEVLGVEQVGIYDNFFHIGGNSLNLVTLSSKLNTALGTNIPIAKLFEYVTISTFARYFTGKETERSFPRINRTVEVNEIAIIGMAGRFPGAKNIDEFWDNLKNGIESIKFLTDDEFKELDPELLKNPNFVKVKGGVLENKDCFDAAFFDYTVMDARVMDPQTRIFHECTYEALENAGYVADTYDGIIGLYAGASPSSTWEALIHFSGMTEELGEFFASQLAGRDFLCTRVAYKLDLKGPAINIQTACSTSLVAVHMACRAILHGECDMALAGGISITHMEKNGYVYQEGMIFSPDGHCRAFDADARGTVNGNGVGIIALKSLKKALEEGDYIHAIIRGTAVNNDGINKAGYTAPSVKGQVAVIQAALQLAQVDPETISYVETHGTGTILGDPIEIEALKQAYNTDKRQYCAIGSVKTNIGHLDAAAGIAGLIKTVLALKNKLLPPSLHYKKNNPKIDFENCPFYVNATLKEWKNEGRPRLAGVSSFGIGGTNAHVILEEAQEIKPRENNKNIHLILLAARTESALEKITRNLVEYLQKNSETNLSDVAYTLQVGRKIFEYKRMMVCDEINGAVDALSFILPGKMKTFFSKDKKTPVILMFPGQGSQYVNMGLELYQNVPLFRDQMDRCFEILKSVIGYDLKEIIYPIAADSDDSSELYSRINLTEITQPVIFAFEYALAKLVMACDIKPYAMIGHSIGEYTAACLAGVFSLEDALTLVSARGRLVSQMPGGAMLSVSIPQSELEPLLIPELSLAAVNGPSNCVVSGSYEAIDTFEKQLQEKGYNSSRLHVSHAFHSKMMEPVLKEFENLVKRVCLNRPVIPFISNVTGDWITVQDVKKPAYWAAHLRKTVRFTDGLSELLKTQNAIFVEVGPGKSLSTFARQHQDKKTEQVVLNLVRHPKENVQDKYYLLNQLGQLWLYGVKIDWSQFYVSEKCCRIPLPAYPFEQQSYQIGEEILKRKDIFPFQQFLKNQVNDLADFFYVPLWKPSITDVVQKEEMMGKTRILVFMDTCGIGEQLSEKLKKEGYDIIAVEQGIEFNKVQDRHYQINPTLINDYHALFNEFYQQDITPQFIVHLWNITRDSDDNLTNFTVEKFENAQYTGFYSLAYIIQAIKKQNMGNNFFKITVIANNIQDITGEENLCPAKATLLAGVIVIPQEWSNIRCFSIDIVLPKQESQQKDKLIQQLKTEILTESTETIIAYRNNRRWVQQFESVKMEKNREFTSRLKQAGVYLITGGLGKIGLVLTEYLARDFGARLILIGRSELPEREVWCNWLSTHNDRDSTSLKILKIQEIEKLGGEILIYSADVADQEQMKNIIARAEKQFGPINGVIHAAGITGGPSNQCATEKISKREGEEQFIPKVYGLLVLEKIFKDKELDFCMVMSSLSSVLGGLGFFAYSAANFFMDAFVKKYTKIHDSRWISVNWDGWQVGDNKDKWSISPKEGKNAFQLILDWGEENQVIVSKTDLQTRINQWVKIGHISESNVLKYENNSLLRKRPNLSTTYMQYRNQFEKALANIWEKFLGLDSIGIYDDFFELGGDSLKAITIIARIHKELNKNVSVAEFFNHPTIEELAKYINNSESIAYHSIKPIEKKEFYFQSSAQKRIYFLQQMDKESTAYHITSAWITEGILDRNKLEDTFVQLVKRHESFRTSFFTVGGELVQRIHVDVAFGIEYFGLTAKDANDCEDIHHSSFIIHHFIRPFDLSQAPLLRVGLVELEEKKHILLVDMHHIISDGISHKILLKDFIDIYIGKELLPLKFQYKDYSEWQNNKKKEIETKKQEEYWLREFKKDIPQLRIPTDYSRNSVQSFEGDIIKFCIAKEEVIKLKDMALEQEVTIFMLLLAIFYVFLFKLTGQEDILVGTGTAGRRHENLQHIIGMFVNTLVLRNYPQGKIYFHEFLHEIKEKILKAFENEDYQFEELVERVAPFNRDVSHNPLFNVMFQFQNIDIPQINITGLTLKPYQHETKISKFDMTLFSWESDQELSFMLEYSTELFKQETIEWFIEYFKRIMLSIIKNPSQKLSEIGSITCEKRKMKLQQFAHNLEAE